jgi:hypothetical protein
MPSASFQVPAIFQVFFRFSSVPPCLRLCRILRAVKTRVRDSGPSRVPSGVPCPVCHTALPVASCYYLTPSAGLPDVRHYPPESSPAIRPAPVSDAFETTQVSKILHLQVQVRCQVGCGWSPNEQPACMLLSFQLLISRYTHGMAPHTHTLVSMFHVEYCYTCVLHTWRCMLHSIHYSPRFAASYPGSTHRSESHAVSSCYQQAHSCAPLRQIGPV